MLFEGAFISEVQMKKVDLDWRTREFNPDWRSPPGDTMMDVMSEKGWTCERFACEMEMSVAEADLLILGFIEISRPIAELLASKLGSTPAFWMRRDQQWRRSKVTPLK
jgi:HTH-type transcriptional regulator/antitoxin HigA